MNIPTQCPVCGAYSMTQEGQASALLAVCDVLVLKALEALGKWLVRADRSRFGVIAGRPYHVAHTVWPAEDTLVDKALRGAWDVVPAMLDSRGFPGVTSQRIVETLDSYVHDLAITGTRHQVAELAYRFETRLGLPVYLHEEGSDHAGV